MITEENLIGKTIKKLSIDGYGLLIEFTDGTKLEYIASGGGHSDWYIAEPPQDEDWF